LLGELHGPVKAGEGQQERREQQLDRLLAEFDLDRVSRIPPSCRRAYGAPPAEAPLFLSI
jgi:hypothetical protein